MGRSGRQGRRRQQGDRPVSRGDAGAGVNPDVHVRLGMAYARQERLDESQAEFEAVLRIDPKSPIARQAIDAIVARRKATGK